MTEQETTTVKLTNGSEENAQQVNATMRSLRKLMNAGHGLRVYELRELCRNPNHELFGNAGGWLAKTHLIAYYEGKGWVDASIRNIVLAAVVGEDADMRIVNPIAKGGTP